MRREIPLPLPSEAGALLGVSLGNALVLAVGIGLGAMVYAAGPGHGWPLTAAVEAATGVALVRLDHEPLWMHVGWWGWYHVTPQRFVPER